LHNSLATHVSSTGPLAPSDAPQVVWPRSSNVAAGDVLLKRSAPFLLRAPIASPQAIRRSHKKKKSWSSVSAG
jgi:hypothetical protein